ncbi:MAG: sigma-70 family RNA polymerase sigma factor, partial [Bacteroidota bacterium]
MLTHHNQVSDTGLRLREGATPSQHTWFWGIWEEHEPFLSNLSKSWMKHPAEAREALSGAMMKAWEGADGRLDRIGNVRAWLARIVRNHCVDLLRQRKRLPRSLNDMEWLGPNFLDESAPREVSPEMDFVQKEGYHRLRSELEELPVRLRDVMMLRAYQDMPYKEIALQLRITPENARKRVQQAREILRERLHPDGGPDREMRAPDPQVRQPRDERRAAEAILRPDGPDPDLQRRYAHPVAVHLGDGRTVETPVFLPGRPARLDQRRKTLLNYVHKHPSGWAKRLELAELLLLTGRWPEAIDHFRFILEKQPQLAQVRLHCVRILHFLGWSTEAVDLLREGLPHLRDAGLAWHFRALIASYSHVPGEAVQFWRLALQTDQGNFTYLEALARHLVRAEMHANAVTVLRDLLRIRPLDRELHALLHEALQFVGTESEQEACVAEMARLFPQDPYAKAFLAHHRIRKGLLSGEEGQRTRAMIRAVRTSVADSALSMHLQLAFHYHRGANEKCRKLLHNHLQKSPRNLQALHYAVHWLHLLGERAAAEAHLDQLRRDFADRPMDLII